MNLIEYFRIAMRRGWIIILTAVLAAITAFAFSQIQTPVYRSTVKLFIKPSRNDLGITEATTRLIRGYETWLNSDLRAAEVINRLELDMMPAHLRSYAHFQTDTSRLIIQIDVDQPCEEGDESELTACLAQTNDIASTWGNLLIEWHEEENQRLRNDQRIEAEMTDIPQIGKFSPKTTVNVLAGAILGAFAGGVIVFFIEYMQAGILRRAEDVERTLELPVLAQIPAEENA
jgi:capsular polysaccharide biosynthesis protein